MLISLLFAWLAVLLVLVTAVKFLTRISGRPAVNRFFSRWHIPLGLLLLAAGLLHGILAGNPAGTAWSEVQLAPVLFTLNWGTGCFLLMLCLLLTYLLRKHLKGRWMPLHRICTLLLLLCLVLHLLDVGIQITQRLFSQQSTPTAEEGGTVLPDSGGAVTFSGAQLKDGVYTGSATGFRGDISVSVTVSGGAVTEITVDSEQDTPQYFSRAQGILDVVLSDQSLEVDVISGATFSSAGLLHAVADALQNAVLSGSLQINSIDTSQIQHGGRH